MVAGNRVNNSENTRWVAQVAHINRTDNGHLRFPLNIE